MKKHVPLSLKGVFEGVSSNPCGESCSRCYPVTLRRPLGTRVPTKPAFLTLLFTGWILSDPLETESSSAFSEPTSFHHTSQTTGPLSPGAGQSSAAGGAQEWRSGGVWRVCLQLPLIPEVMRSCIMIPGHGHGQSEAAAFLQLC